MVSLAAQLVPAALLLALWTGASGLGATLHLSSVPLRAWGALAFLVVASTLVGYAIFLALNRSASTVLANSFNYVAPVIALILSHWLLGEPLGWAKAVGAAITLLGVAMMVTGKRDTPHSRPAASPDAG